MTCKHYLCSSFGIGHCLLAVPKCDKCEKQAVGTCSVRMEQPQNGVTVSARMWTCEDHRTHAEFTPLKETNWGIQHGGLVDKEIDLQKRYNRPKKPRKDSKVTQNDVLKTTHDVKWVQFDGNSSKVTTDWVTASRLFECLKLCPLVKSVEISAAK